ncbi:hypothetical protein FB45DRAFT_1029581 [Roridomyces roridus]|uniref:Uncharacterized protein n=1 Tax=Roridomyces roridus TaxID=1738132 RepID=A0AAD7BQC0_9AGAR|nr:hypothetical protein FB45DRAFT_1029581 [Roridomyces roridus]
MGKRGRSNSGNRYANIPSKKSRSGAGGTPSTATAAPAKRGKKQYAMTQHAVKAKKALGTQRAFHLHIRTIWGLFTQESIPPPVSGDLIQVFNRRYTSEDAVEADVATLLRQQAQPFAAQAVSIVTEIQQVAILGRSQTACDLREVGEEHLQMTFNTIARAGLRQWAPDVLGTPDSIYNTLHMRLAISTFKAVATGFGYTHMRPNLANLNDFPLLVQLYENFVYCHMAKIARKEAKSPGRVALDIAKNNTYRRRIELGDGRVEQLQADGFSPEVLALAEEVEGHSDDEPDPQTGHYAVHEKPGRARMVGGLFRLMDSRHKDGAGRNGAAVNRTRVDSNLGPSEISLRHPLHVPLDYFEPDYYNTVLSLRERAMYMNNGIALPTEAFCTSWSDVEKWKNLPRDAFMTQYGRAKLDLYKVPTPEELAQLDEYYRVPPNDVDHV